MARAYVDEVNVHVVDCSHELRERVELGLELAPVVVRSPIAQELLEFGQLDALRTVVDCLLIRPARRGDAPAKIGERLLRNVDLEGLDGVVSRPGNVLRQEADSSRGS